MKEARPYQGSFLGMTRVPTVPSRICTIGAAIRKMIRPGRGGAMAAAPGPSWPTLTSEPEPNSSTWVFTAGSSS